MVPKRQIDSTRDVLVPGDAAWPSVADPQLMLKSRHTQGGSLSPSHPLVRRGVSDVVPSCIRCLYLRLRFLGCPPIQKRRAENFAQYWLSLGLGLTGSVERPRRGYVVG